MNCLGIILARTTSLRLPGKVLRPIAGRPLLDLLISRLRQSSELSEFLVATSTDNSDEPVVSYCAASKIACFRGSLDDPAGRIGAVLREYKPESFARISADSPFYDPALLDEHVRYFSGGKYDLVTNVLERSFPKGQSVEIISSDVYLRDLPLITKPEDREHVTKYFYDHRTSYRIHNITCPSGDLSAVNFCVDTEEDLRRAENIVSRMDRSPESYGRSELVDLYRAAEHEPGGTK